MTREEIYGKLNEVFQDVFDDEDITVNDSTVAADVDGWDSLEHINLIVAVERCFGIKFTMGETTDHQKFNGTYSGITFTDGVSVPIMIKDGQNVYIEGLPHDTPYTVTETVDGNLYTTEWSDGNYGNVLVIPKLPLLDYPLFVTDASLLDEIEGDRNEHI